VAGVVAALEADHEVRVLGEQVDDLALALVAPLGAHDHRAGHAVSEV
jgi:hypothetical protein